MDMSGAHIIWECLIREGVCTVFGYPGGAVLNLAVTVAGCLVAGALGLFVGGLFPGAEAR